IDDLLVEDNETLTLTLSNPVNATIAAAGSATLTILEDDQPQLNIDAATYSLAENGGMLDMTLSLNVMSFMPISVDVMSADVEALAGVDYVAVNQAIVFAAGETNKTVTLMITDDGEDEPDETFTLALFNVVNATAGMTSTTTVTILDDDVPTLSLDLASVTVSEAALTLSLGYSLDFAAYQDVTFDAASADLTALAGVDFVAFSEMVTISAGDTSGALVIDLINDVFIEADKTFNVNLSNISGAMLGVSTTLVTLTSEDLIPTLTIAPLTLDAAEGAGPQQLTLTLSEAFTSAISVRAQTLAGTASAGTDFVALDQTIVFQAGEMIKTITLNMLDDGVFEDDEAFEVALSNPFNVLLDPQANSSTITILNDDAMKPPLAPSFISLSLLDPDNAYRAGDTITIEANMGVGGLTMSADLSVIDSAFSTSEVIPYFGSGRYRLTTPALNALTLLEGKNTPVQVQAMDALGQSISAWLAITVDASPPTGQLLFNAPTSSVPAGDLKITLAFDEPVVDLPLITITGLGLLDTTNAPMQGTTPSPRFTYTLNVPNGATGVGVVTVSPTQDLAGNPANLPAGVQITVTGGAPVLLADAGQDSAIGSPGQVVLDGRASIGVQNFQWTQLAGPVVAPIASATLEQAVATLSAAG
ncbi:MAG: hypothetical protein KDB07_07175, partial [Planctomycetes bacterium]|nr:hypothetical protein [Planctomycetota bacterium]